MGSTDARRGFQKRFEAVVGGCLLTGVHELALGEMLVGGKPMHLEALLDAMEAGIATVFRDRAMIPLVSVARNVLMNCEPRKRRGPFERSDVDHADDISKTEMPKMGIDRRGPDQAVDTLSGGEFQTVAIARAVFFSSVLLILHESTSALGVRQTSNGLATRCSSQSEYRRRLQRSRGPPSAGGGDRFAVANRGGTPGTARRGEISPGELRDLMDGGQEMTKSQKISGRNRLGRVAGKG